MAAPVTDRTNMLTTKHAAAVQKCAHMHAHACIQFQYYNQYELFFVLNKQSGIVFPSIHTLFMLVFMLYLYIYLYIHVEVYTQGNVRSL